MEDIVHAIPKVAHHRIFDLLSDSTSKETKLATCRWFVEMIIDVFLSDFLINEVGEKEYGKMSLFSKIEKIKNSKCFDVSIGLIMDEIRVKGNSGAHYNQDLPTDYETKETVFQCLRIFDLLLVDWFQKNGFDKTRKTAVIFSTLLPSTRVRVLKHFCKEENIVSSYDKAIFHKLLLAHVKNHEVKTAKELLERAKNSEKINDEEYFSELESIEVIAKKMTDSLPVAKNLSDSKRNFSEVVNSLSEQDKSLNSGLIEIIVKLLEDITPSDMGNLKGFQEFISTYSVDYR